jgi:hypothetical protein
LWNHSIVGTGPADVNEWIGQILQKQKKNKKKTKTQENEKSICCITILVMKLQLMPE